jgi:uncharacterized protein (TIGR03382 family)
MPGWLRRVKSAAQPTSSPCWACWSWLASLVFAFTVSRVVYGFAYGRPLVTVGPAVITLEITASLVAACVLAWLLRRRIHASPPMTS